MVLLEPNRSGLAISFFHNQEIIYWQVLEPVHDAARPSDFQHVDFFVLTQAKKNPGILRGTVTHPAFRLIVARQISSDHFERSAVPIAITFRSN
jgi:hypothetical protein